MRVVAQFGTPISLAPGTYWVQFQFGGTVASGPWAPPVTILGQTATGNGLQSLAGVWGQALDGTFHQDLPFIIIGTETGGGGNTYFEDFDGFICWSASCLSGSSKLDNLESTLPCGAEDAYISTNYAYSGSKFCSN